MSATATQLWTPERATRALPLVRRIADDLVRTYAEWRSLMAQFEVANIATDPDRPDSEAVRLQKEVQRAATEIEGLMRELAELGVECKSLETGLFDFPGEHEGRPVYYCWMHGERSVSHWHEIDAGFSGRQPLP